MKKIKSFLYRFKDQRGIGVVGFLTIMGIVVVSAAILKFAYEPDKSMDEFTKDLTLDEFIEEREKRQKKFLEKIEEADEVVKNLKPVVDPIPSEKFYEEVGVYNVPEEYKTEEQKAREEAEKQLKEERDRKVEEKLEKIGLPTDPLTKVIYQSVEDITSEYISYDAIEEYIDRVTTNIVEELVNKDPEKIETKDSSEVLNSIRNNLKENEILENDIVIEKRMEYNGALIKKESLEKKIEAWDYLERWGFADASEYAGLRERLDKVNEKISDIENELSLICEGKIEIPEIPTYSVLVTSGIPGRERPAGVYFTKRVGLHIPQDFTRIVMTQDSNGTTPIGIDDEAKVTVTGPSGRQQAAIINRNDAWGEHEGEQYVLSKVIEFEPGQNSITVELINVYAPQGPNSGCSAIYLVVVP